MNKPRVIIIGNSPVILQHEYGSVIDSFNTIIRINHCPTIGYESSIGSRTDVWSTTHQRFHPDFWPHNSKLTQIWTRTPTVRLEIPPDVDMSNTHTMTLLKCSQWKNGITKKGKSFSSLCTPLSHEPCTGIATILASTQWDWDITIHGFTFYTESKNATGYYREGQLDEKGNHPEDKYWEKSDNDGFASIQEGTRRQKIIDTLVNDGEIKILKQ